MERDSGSTMGLENAYESVLNFNLGDVVNRKDGKKDIFNML